jgi:4-hydroxybenzoate polyprenyltransferase
MFQTIQKWGSFVRFSHTVFALPFALAAMLVAARDHRGWPGWKTFGLIVAAMICARTCAMAFNRIVDRKFDALNPRRNVICQPEQFLYSAQFHFAFCQPPV